MIIKVKDQIEREITIEFPSFYKVVQQYSKTKYYAFFSEKIGLFVTEGFTYETTPNSLDFKVAETCTYDEVNKVFMDNQSKFDVIMQGITVDLNSNTPTEVLEQVKFERQSESVEMKHDFNK